MNIRKNFTLQAAFALAILMLPAAMVQAGPGRGIGGFKPPRPIRPPYHVFRPRSESSPRSPANSVRNRGSDPRHEQSTGHSRNSGNNSNQGGGNDQNQDGEDDQNQRGWGGANGDGGNATATSPPAQGRYLGIMQQAVIDPEGRVGIQVMSVTPGSPAHLVGLESGDVILSANGYSMQDVGTLPWLVNSLEWNGALALRCGMCEMHSSSA